MKKLLITLFFALNTIFTLGQNLYLKAGIGTNDITAYFYSYGFIGDLKNAVTADIGVIYKMSFFNNKMRFYTGLSIKYQPILYKAENILIFKEDTSYYGNYKNLKKNIFLQVPLIFPITNNKRFNINIGLLNNILVNKEKDKPYEKYMLGGILGVELLITQKISINLSGYTDITPYYDDFSGRYNLYNYGASLSIMYKLSNK